MRCSRREAAVRHQQPHRLAGTKEVGQGTRALEARAAALVLELRRERDVQGEERLVAMAEVIEEIQSGIARLKKHGLGERETLREMLSKTLQRLCESFCERLCRDFARDH